MTVRTIASLVLVATYVLAAPSAPATADPDPTPTPARIAYPGGLDRTFGVGGNATPPADLMAVWEAVAVQANGKSVVVGNVGYGEGVVIARYDTNGILDESFGSNGIVSSILPFSGFASAVAVAKDGYILVAGVAYHDPAIDSGADVTVIRLDDTGAVNAAFGAGGIATIDVGENPASAAIVLPADGGVVVLSGTNPRGGGGDAVLLGLRNDGRLDRLFGQAGIVRITGSALETTGASGIVEEPDGRFVVAVNSFTDQLETQRLRVMRFDRDGHLARTFEELPGYAASIARIANGEIVVDGSASAPDFSIGANPALLHFTYSGALDQTFGDHGILGSIEEEPGKIVVDDRNRFVVVADVLTRHYSDGVLDTSFGVDGVVANSRFAVYRDAAIQPDGKIVAAGGGCFSNPKAGSGCLTSLARYESDRTQLCGDADANGTFSVTDGVAALRGAAGFADGCGPLVCDVDGSGAVTVTDAVNVLRAAAGLSATLGCGIP